MSRPIYQNKKNTDDENFVAAFFWKNYRVISKRLPWFYFLDFGCFDKKKNLLFFYEVKGRDCTLGGYDWFILSLHKAKVMREFEVLTNKKSAIVFKFHDHMAWTGSKNFEFYDVIWGGRKDRGDEADEEPVIKINQELLTTDFSGLVHK